MISLAGPTDITFTEDVVRALRRRGWHTNASMLHTPTTSPTIDQRLQWPKASPNGPRSICSTHSIIGFGSPRAGHVRRSRRTAGRRERQEDEGSLGWPLEPAFLVPDDVQTYFREGAKRPMPKPHWRSGTLRTPIGSAPTRISAAQFERARDGKLPADLPWPAFNAENGSVATRDAGGTVMNAIAKALPELVGGSADLDPSTKTYLKDGRRFPARARTPGATSTTACANTRWRRRPTASRCTAG